MELGRAPSIFIDDQLEVGAAWPVQLGAALGQSRTLIALWTKRFLDSVWCVQELGVMVSRAEQLGLGTVARPHGVIIPAFIHDGDSFPPGLSHIQELRIQSFYNSRLAKGSPLAEQLEAAIAARSADIAACIENAPPWDPAWPKQAAQGFLDKYQGRDEDQTTVPRFTT